MTTTSTQPGSRAAGDTSAPFDDGDVKRIVAEMLEDWPSAGVGIGIVRNGSLERFLGHGVADVDTADPVTPDTVFRVGSITKTFTAIAVVQLREQGLVDLDAPASDYLRAFRLVATDPGFRPATLRHLLTHTAGIGYWRRRSDLLHPAIGSADRAGRATQSLSEYYRRGLPIDVEPGTRWGYTNHGFAALGQIVEDVTGEPIDRYLRDHVFEPLGMRHTDLVPSDRVPARRATGYLLRNSGLRAVADPRLPAPAASAAYSTVSDMARYVTALVHEGCNEHGSVLEPESMASMLRAHFRVDARDPGMGLAFHLEEELGHRTAGHTGILSGFQSAMLVAPDDATGVVVLANTGGLDGRGAPERLAAALLRHALALPAGGIRTDLAPRPQVWRQLCGWYSPDAGPVTNLFPRILMGAGAEVAVHHGHLVLRPLTPVPGVRARLRLYPDDPVDPHVFRVDFSQWGYAPRRVVFTGAGAVGGPATHLFVGGLPFRRRPDAMNPRWWVRGVAAAGATALAVRYRR